MTTTPYPSDASALRVLAHPLRTRILAELRTVGPSTASDLARALDTNSGATSYHLRALEKAGIVVRDGATQDGRQRPWKAAADSLSIRPEAHRAAGVKVTQASLAGWATDLEAGLDRLGQALAAGHENVGHTSHSRLWLSESEIHEIVERVRELADEYTGRNRADHPEDAVPWDTYLLMLPVEELE